MEEIGDGHARGSQHHQGAMKCVADVVSTYPDWVFLSAEHMRGSHLHPDILAVMCVCGGGIRLNLASGLQVEVMCVTYTLKHVMCAASLSCFLLLPWQPQEPVVRWKSGHTGGTKEPRTLSHHREGSCPRELPRPTVGFE